MAENTRVELFTCQCRSPLCRVLWTETEDMDGEVSRVIEFPVCISPVGISEKSQALLNFGKTFLFDNPFVETHCDIKEKNGAKVFVFTKSRRSFRGACGVLKNWARFLRVLILRGYLLAVDKTITVADCILAEADYNSLCESAGEYFPEIVNAFSKDEDGGYCSEDISGQIKYRLTLAEKLTVFSQGLIVKNAAICRSYEKNGEVLTDVIV